MYRLKKKNEDHGISFHYFMANTWRNNKTVTGFIIRGSKITGDSEYSCEKRDPHPWKNSYEKPRQCIKKQRHYFADKGPYSQSYGFPSSHVWM